MKSAFELALERTGGKLTELSEEKKNKISDIDRFYKSKIAEAELSAQQRIAREQDPAKIDEIKESLVTEIASFRDKCEREKNAVRSE
ncbi:MAG: hypothetical protein BWY31_01009 [Lentisphaerae bacterium ADurb.Bin242]|nr:MAG: hypothetical protein BWY31_01009 [Lentisphaerae bacterium ADurb.Bin242]